MEHISVKSSVTGDKASFTFTSGSEGEDSKLNLNNGYLGALTDSKIDGTDGQGLGTTTYAGEAVTAAEKFYANINGQSLVVTPAAVAANGTMKDIVEKSVPFVNRINPASLISDAFYCINVYDDMTRYYRNLITLAVMCMVLVMASFFMVRRERYDSI